MYFLCIYLEDVWDPYTLHTLTQLHYDAVWLPSQIHRQRSQGQNENERNQALTIQNNFPQLNPRHIALKTNEVPRDSVWKGCQQGAEKEEVKTHFSFLTNQFLWKEAPAILRMVLSLSLVCILSSLSPYLLLHLWKYFCNLIFFFFFFMFLHPFFGLGKFKSSCFLDKMI